ncbi:DUF1566 domain-containing protein [Alcaligenaceae bacterium]|nr:DUF1566 domain-containing protein [Alcaligenaceae bacterium]
MTTVTQQTTIPTIGHAWPEQGGIYIGSLMKDGALHHLFVPGGPEHDIEDVSFNDAAQAVQDKGEINDHADWRVPDQRELMLAYINTPELFSKDDWYWTSTPIGSSNAWAVGFEDGYVHGDTRRDEFRVRPFRSIIASSL